MKFKYFGGEQRSPEWCKLRIGRVTSSRLSDWLSVSKAAKTKGKPLKARLDYEKELAFERQFGVAYQNYVSAAMQDGIDYEDFVRSQYELITGNKTEPCGAWYSDLFLASPDGIVNDDGLIEIKVVRDATFTDILLSGVPDKHWKQIQGQLLASGRTWCDYVAFNLNTKHMKVIRIEVDDEFHEYLEEALKENFVSSEFDSTDLHEVKGDIIKTDNMEGLYE